MNYIYQHSDPKILKLGIGWALYDEPMPEKNISVKGVDFTLLSRRDYWRKTHRIAYLKEPEFKVGDIYYVKETGFKGKIETENQTKQANQSNYLSHYYPGQEYDGEIKYVREINFYEFKKVPDDGSKWNEWKNNKWQELEEPDNCDDLYNITDIDWDGNDRNIFLEDRFNEDYTQFQEDVDKGIILAVINI